MKIYIDLLLIAVIISFIIDLSGIVDSLKKLLINKILGFKDYNISLKPFDCSLCMTFWTGLLFIIITNNISLFNIMVICLLAYMADITTLILITIKDLIGKIINKILNYANETK